jgi:acetyl esterase/lipase
VAADLIHFSVPHVSPETLTFKQGLTLDLYRRADGQARMPVIIVLHGGSWHYGDKSQIPSINHYLALRGYAVAAVNYRKASAHPFPAARDDVIAAVEHLKVCADAFKLDPQRFVLLGRSAGGQLALVAAYGTPDPAIRGVVSSLRTHRPSVELEHPGNPLVWDTHNLLHNFLGGSPDEKPDAYHEASPLQLAHSLAPATLVFHGGRDEMRSAF